MKLIVGLGNPGTKYEKTRHNAGFMAARAFHQAHAGEFGGWQKKFNSEISEGRIGDEKVVLILPQTFMNVSGDAIAPAVGFWHVEPKDVVLVYDDLDIPLGNVRIRAGGSAGGHNGVKSVLAALTTQDVPRIRIGIGSERSDAIPSEDYVLEKFTVDEEAVLLTAITTAVQALDALLTEGIEAVGNKFGK